MSQGRPLSTEAEQIEVMLRAVDKQSRHSAALKSACEFVQKSFVVGRDVLADCEIKRL